MPHAGKARTTHRRGVERGDALQGLGVEEERQLGDVERGDDPTQVLATPAPPRPAVLLPAPCRSTTPATPRRSSAAAARAGIAQR